MTRFLALLGSAITSGQAHVADAETGGAPEDAGAWGWRKKDFISGGFGHEEWQPRGSLVGWLDGDDLLLDPEAAFAAAQRLARDQGGGLLITAQTLWKRMAEQGKLAAREGQRRHLTVRRTIGQRRRYVINIFTDTLLCPVSGPCGPCSPEVSKSAPLRATNLGHKSDDEEKVAHKSGPKPAENGDGGPIGPHGPQMGDKGLPPEEIISDGVSTNKPAAIDGGEI